MSPDCLHKVTLKSILPEMIVLPFVLENDMCSNENVMTFH